MRLNIHSADPQYCGYLHLYLRDAPAVIVLTDSHGASKAFSRRGVTDDYDEVSHLSLGASELIRGE